MLMLYEKKGLKSMILKKLEKGRANLIQKRKKEGNNEDSRNQWKSKQKQFEKKIIKNWKLVLLKD